MNKNELKIIKEEFARAVMIKSAKRRLDEASFTFFMNELRDYEQNLVIAEGASSETLYEGLFDRLKNLAKGMAKKIAPDNLEKIDQLAQQLADADIALDTAEEIGRTPNEIKALQVKRNVLLKQLAAIDPGYAQQAQQAADAENSADPNAAASGGGAGSSDGINFDNPQAAGIWQNIKGIYGDYFTGLKSINRAQYDLIYKKIQQAANQSPEKEKEAISNIAADLKNAPKSELEKTKDTLARIYARQGRGAGGEGGAGGEDPDAPRVTPPDPGEGGEGGEGGEASGEGAGALSKETPLSITKRQRDVKAGAGGEKEMPLVMSIQKQGFDQATAQKLAKRIAQYLKQRNIPIAEAIKKGIVDRMLLEVKKLNLITEAEEEKAPPIRTARRKRVNRKNVGPEIRKLRDRVKEIEDEIKGHEESGNKMGARLAKGDLEKTKDRLAKAEGSADSLKATDKKYKEEYDAEVAKLRKYIRTQGKDIGVVGKILSRFISDNQDLIDKDPKIKDVLSDPKAFKKFAKSVNKNIKRMLQRRGYTDQELSGMNLLEYVEANLKLLILESRRSRDLL